MSVTRNIVKGVVKPMERAVEFGGQVIRLVFNGTDQYATHSAWTPTGANFTQSVKYTPYTNAIGSAVTILGDHLTKNASDQLVYSYTDTAAGAQTVTLTAVTLVADTEYTIGISSDGNGVTLAIGADEATNSAVVDPSTLSFETWMRDSGGTDYNHGVVRDIQFTDLSLIQDGDFLTADGGNLWVDVPDIELSGAFKVEGYLKHQSIDSEYLGGTDGDASTLFLDYSGGIRAFAFDSGGSLVFGPASLSSPPASQYYHYLIERDEANDMRFYVDGVQIGSTANTSEVFYIGAFYRRQTAYANAGDLFTVDINDGEYTYLLNNIIDNGDGTGTAPNTGSSEGVINNFEDPVVGAEWTDNNDGSYTLNGTGAYNALAENNLDNTKSYRVIFDVSGLSGDLALESNPNPQRTISANGTYEYVISGSSYVVFKRASGAVSCTVSNIQVIETYYGTVNDYDAGTDLVTVANNTRSYPVNVDSETQPDILNPGGGNDATIVNYNLAMVSSSQANIFDSPTLESGWLDNGGGSYSFVGSLAASLVQGAVLTIGRYYRLRFTLDSITSTVGSPSVGFSGLGFNQSSALRSIDAVGSLDVVLECTGTTLKLFFTGGTGTCTVSNIIVQDVTP